MLSNYLFTRKASWEKTEEEEKFTRLYQTYCLTMYQTAYSILCNSTMAEDAVQEACVKLLQHLDSIQEEDTFRTIAFLKTVVRNTALTMKKKSQRELPYEPNVLDTLPLETSPSPETQFLNDDLAGKLQEFIGDLKPKNQKCIELFYFHNYSAEQIAASLNISCAAVRKRLQRSKETLKKRLEKEGLL